MKKVIFQKKSDILTIICRIDLSGLVCRLCLGHLSVISRSSVGGDPEVMYGGRVAFSE